MKRGEIWTVSGGGNYTGKPRPAVILQDDEFDATDSITICPFTTDDTKAPLIRLAVEPDDRNGLGSPSRIMVDKITTVAKRGSGGRSVDSTAKTSPGWGGRWNGSWACRKEEAQRTRTDTQQSVAEQDRQMDNWTQEALEQALRTQGWYKDKKPISHGIQFRLSDDTPIDFYSSTGKIVVRGKVTPLKKAAEEFFGVPASSRSSVVGSPGPRADGEQPESAPPKRVFIVYGHDASAREQLELFLRRLKLEPIVLQNLTGGGDTIIENLDKLTNADFACVLLTPDDEGRLRDSDQSLKPRSRQNVVLELGMVLAKLGRRRVAILVKDTREEPIERPTDIEGIIYITFMEHIKEIRIKLATRLQEVGFDIKVGDLGD